MGSKEDCSRVCRVLAAQVAEVQARLESSSQELVATLDRLDGLLTADSDRNSAQARETAAMQDALDGLLFAQAQEHDIIRQMMGVIAHALSLLPDHIDPDRLVGLYISDAQRNVHRAALERGDAD
ncbi:hypothetical protein [Roseomonas genomospecies 6]|uniref:Uncharacterized protein n=1 Tax=Roseomonas genomospecies 6 TaxID=214106 RepID=A0A9W7TY84_9PROT|nr:hypothetical protein [Roseomonas genomospecies 6]KAA0680749.1 hypothetical protein DS843_13010 [Roseomonas genomospecies 6]